jgi:hypothetical protein
VRNEELIEWNEYQPRLAMILPATFIILACHACHYYEHVLPTWVPFTVLRLFVVLTVAYGRLDLVRTLGAFLGFEVFYYHAWEYCVLLSHPMVAEGKFDVVTLVRTMLSIGIPAALFLLLLSRSAYFRAGNSARLSFMRAALLLPVMFVLSAIQGL